MYIKLFYFLNAIFVLTFVTSGMKRPTKGDDDYLGNFI